MFLEEKIQKLNTVALDIINAINGIQIGYLSSNKKYPYNDIDILMYNYLVLYDKYNKKRNSVCNKIINNILINKLSFCENDLYDEKRILMMASEKTLFYIFQNIEQYIPDNEHSVVNISDKLYPIIKNLNMDTIVLTYKKFKSYVEGRKSINTDEILLYLQRLFMGYVMYKIRIYNVNGHEVKMTYKEACRYILNEDVIDLPKKIVKKNVAC